MTQPNLLRRQDLQRLFDALQGEGYRCVGPRVRDGAIFYEEVRHAAQLPVGYRDEQGPGSYRLHPGAGPRCFTWANGPQALKPYLFAPREALWRTSCAEDGALRFERVAPRAERLAVIGARACDLAALRLHDKHFLHHTPDPWYRARRSGVLLVAVDCSHPAATCFCASTGDGPAVTGGTDLALSELDEGFLVRAYTDAGKAICALLPLAQATDEQRAHAHREVQSATASQIRRIPGRRLREPLFANLDHPRWAEVALRCLSCGNCVSVCPSCFCHAEQDQGALDGSTSEHVRQWDSCFSAEHSYLHGRPLRSDTRARYRQWLTHKLGAWHDQYGRAGCVGCGRCIAWCPVGIDITEEAAAICTAGAETAT